MTDELARWAAERAPELRARAEAEAVAMLRDALVAAAMPSKVEPQQHQVQQQPRRSAPQHDLVWAYCVLSAEEPTRAGVVGVDGNAQVERVEAGGLVALVSKVPGGEFGEEPLRQNLNDLAWLERVARAHEAVLDQALASATIVPLRLCTLYESEQSVREMLARERAAFARALDFLAGREEWAAKVLIDTELLGREAQTAADADTGNAEPASAGAGGAYLLGRRREREVRQASATLAAQVAERVHSALEESALDTVKRPPQNRDLSRHEGEMVLNAAYLVETERVEELRERAEALEAEYARYGARIELTGPWPPYNFVPGGGTATIA